VIHVHEVNEAERAHIAAFWPQSDQEEFVWNVGAGRLAHAQLRISSRGAGDESERWIYVTIGLVGIDVRRRPRLRIRSDLAE
jgi:hypothetical protein